MIPLDSERSLFKLCLLLIETYERISAAGSWQEDPGRSCEQGGATAQTPDSADPDSADDSAD